jgi:hypothetical protein
VGHLPGPATAPHREERNLQDLLSIVIYLGIARAIVG